MVIKMLFSLIFLQSIFLLEAKSCVNDGQILGKLKAVEAMKLAEEIRREDLLREFEKSKTFDPDDAYRNVESNTLPPSESVRFLTSAEVRKNERENKNFNEDELFLQKSEAIANQADKGVSISEVKENDGLIRTCRQAGDPILMATDRSLHVEIEHQPGIEKKICLGHEEKRLVKIKGSFEYSVADLKKSFDQDSTIKSYSIDWIGIVPDHYVARVKWTHKNNVEICDQCRLKVIKEASIKETSEEWIYDNQELWNLTKNPECTVIERACLDVSPKEINGAHVQKQCWKERISFFYQFPKTKECGFLRRKHCEQLNQRCIQESPFGCALWEITFKCFDHLTYKQTVVDPDDITGLNANEWEREYQPNNSFGEVTAKLAVFEEAKKELEKAKIKDASKLEIFSGKKMKCSKSVANNLLYDCCFSYSGLAKKLGLSKCDSDEISLAEMRENGLCHYVGSYEKKVLGIKSSDEHVFCCFPSKLGRIVQEEGRKQLKSGWGEPEEPHCRGINFQILAKLDFSKMDLSEMYEEVNNTFPDDFDDKMQSFQNKLKQQIQKEEKESRK